MSELQAVASVHVLNTYKHENGVVEGFINVYGLFVRSDQEFGLIVTLQGDEGGVDLAIQPDQARKLGKALLEATDPERN